MELSKKYNAGNFDRRNVLSSPTTLRLGIQQHITASGTYILPSISGLSNGDTVVLTKDIDITCNVRVNNISGETIRIGTSSNIVTDTEIIFDINSEIIFIFNGTDWEI